MDAAYPEEDRVIEPPFSLDAFAALSVEERRPYFEAAAASRGTIPIIIEKDFWVVWTLKHLFALPDRERFIFKGGTSLSKAFGIIERFSEDIDLVIDRRYFGFSGGDDIAAAPSANQQNVRLGRLEGAIGNYVRTNLIPALKASFDSVLTTSSRLEVDAESEQIVLFHFPANAEHEYIRSAVLIETGGNADNWPTVQRQIRPYVFDDIPEAFDEPDVTVTTIDAPRTFWEKLTILHKTAHRLDLEPGWRPPARYSRHYYDVYRLSRSGAVTEALPAAALADAVRIAAETFYPDRKAKYDEFKKGSVRVVPSASGIDALQRDYVAMRDMIFGEYPGFEEIVSELKRIEDYVNKIE